MMTCHDQGSFNIRTASAPQRNVIYLRCSDKINQIHDDKNLVLMEETKQCFLEMQCKILRNTTNPAKTIFKIKKYTTLAPTYTRSCNQRFYNKNNYHHNYMKYLSAKFNMASRKVLAPKLYKKFLQVCEQWPVDQNRLGRDFGEHLKGSLVPRIKKSEIDVSDVSCHRQNSLCN